MTHDPGTAGVMSFKPPPQQAMFAALTHSMRLLSALVPLSLLVGQGAAAQEDGPLDGQQFYPEHIAEDLEAWRSTLHEAHADPYRHVTKGALDRAIDEAIARADRPLTSAQVADLVMPVLQLIGDGHTEVALPPDLEVVLREQVPLLPLSLRVVDGDLYVQEELKGFRSIPSGSRIMSINGRDARMLVDSLLAHVVADAGDTLARLRRVERDLPYLMYRHHDRSGEFTVDFVPYNGLRRTERLAGLSGAEVRRSLRPEATPLLPWSAAHHPDHRTTWLRMRSFDPDTLRLAGIKPERFVEDLRRDLARKQPGVLVVDLRGAGGQDLSLAELAHSIYARQPYRVLQDMTVRLSAPPTHRQQCSDLTDHLAAIPATYLPGDHGRHHLRPDDPRLEPLSPDPNAFDGRVYVLCDAHTLDAAAALVMMGRRSKRATVVGEPVGTNCLSSCGGRILEFHAPRTGLVFRIPVIRYVYDGSPTGALDRGEQPDRPFPMEVRALATGRDLLKDALMELILELQ